MMELFELRTIVDNTPNSSWEEVIEWEVLLIVKSCYALCLFVFTIGGVMVFLGWCKNFVEVLK